MATPDFDERLEALSHPDAYSCGDAEVEVLQTHISAVFLVGDRAYKLKKPLDLGFLDFSTLDRRKAACEEEVRLNRRLAPDVYRGVVPITQGPDGIRIEGKGRTIDYAVWMDRLPANRTFEKLLQQGAIGASEMERLARLVARFHRQGACNPEIAAEARWSVIARNSRENFEQIRGAVGRTLSQNVYDRLDALCEAALREFRPLIDARASSGLPRDTHGDLHLDHVYSLPRTGREDELVIIDCIEFNTRFRYADPVSDIAFLVMDLEFHGRADLARTIADTYFREMEDVEGRKLLGYYSAYRAIVRGKVEGLALDEPEVPIEHRRRLQRLARARFLLALRFLAPPVERPALVLVAGLPGSGKSELCRRLGDAAGMTRLDSDRVRKELAAIPPGESAASEWNAGIYTPEWNDRTYETLRERAGEALFDGHRVVLEASFREERRRLPFLELARSMAVPCLFLECQADAEVIRGRLARRLRDVSDAGLEVFESARRNWEEAGPDISRIRHLVSTEGDQEQALQSAMRLLRAEELA